MSEVVYTTGDLADLAGVARSTASNWYRRGHGPNPDLFTASRMPLWYTLNGWLPWLREQGYLD